MEVLGGWAKKTIREVEGAEAVLEADENGDVPEDLLNRDVMPESDPLEDDGVREWALAFRKEQLEEAEIC